MYDDRTRRIVDAWNAIKRNTAAAGGSISSCTLAELPAW